MHMAIFGLCVPESAKKCKQHTWPLKVRAHPVAPSQHFYTNNLAVTTTPTVPPPAPSSLGLFLKLHNVLSHSFPSLSFLYVIFIHSFIIQTHTSIHTHVHVYFNSPWHKCTVPDSLQTLSYKNPPFAQQLKGTSSHERDRRGEKRLRICICTGSQPLQVKSRVPLSPLNSPYQ